MYFLRESKKICSYISYIFWKRAITFKSRQVFFPLKLTDSNANHFHSSYNLTIKQKPELRLNGMVTPPLWIFGFFIFYLYGMTEHGNSFLKSIISSYELHSFLRYLILKLEKVRQPVTKYIETTNFAKVSPSSPFDQCWWVCKLHRDHAAEKLLTHNIDIGERDGDLNGAIFKFFEGKPW